MRGSIYLCAIQVWPLDPSLLLCETTFLFTSESKFRIFCICKIEIYGKYVECVNPPYMDRLQPEISITFQFITVYNV